MSSASISFDRMLKDLFSTNPPEWVIRARAERAEIERTGKRVIVDEHLDNTGASCRNVGLMTLVYDMSTHDCCYNCNDAGATHEEA